jgi:hypothetical protein
MQDQLGSCALLEACKHGHDGLVALLRQVGQTVGRAGGRLARNVSAP